MSKIVLRVGHSPDSDDAFMFYALANDKIDTGPYEFRHQLEDIETLNRRALNGELEISAVSIHAYSKIADKYALLSSGASMGDNYGPMVVSREPFDRSELATKKIAIPGTMTSAFLALRLYLGKPFNYEVIPFDQILQAVSDRKVDAGLIIHEGQLMYKDLGFTKIVDLGEWWHGDTGLPLPLGGNVVRKDLGEQVIKDVDRLLKASVKYALDHRAPALDHAMQYARDLDRGTADTFVGMYVNDWTLDYGEAGRKAVRLFLDRGVSSGMIEKAVPVEFISSGS